MMAKCKLIPFLKKCFCFGLFTSILSLLTEVFLIFKTLGPRRQRNFDKFETLANVAKAESSTKREKKVKEEKTTKAEKKEKAADKAEVSETAATHSTSTTETPKKSADTSKKGNDSAKKKAKEGKKEAKKKKPGKKWVFDYFPTYMLFS